MEDTAFEVEREGYVCKVVLNRPGQSNALGTDFWPELKEVFKELTRDPEVRAVVVSAAGPDFSIGLNLSESLQRLPSSPDAAVEIYTAQNFILEIQDSLFTMEDCVKPVIAAIHGRSLGGGLDLAAAADFRLAAVDAWFSLREPGASMIMDLGVLQRLPAIIGEGPTRELVFTGRDFDANRALALGLVNAVHPGREQCLEAALALAEEIAKNSPLGIQAGKQVLNHRSLKPGREDRNYLAARNAQILRTAEAIEAFARTGSASKADRGSD